MFVLENQLTRQDRSGRIDFNTYEKKDVYPV